jgi:uncharacterized membrane protein YedE/YeeE
MKDLIKYSGILLVLIGALLLVIPALMNVITNGFLVAAAILFVVGIIAHIALNKYIQE